MRRSRHRTRPRKWSRRTSSSPRRAPSCSSRSVMRRERISCARPYQGVIGTPAAKGDDRRSERFRLTKNPFISVVDDDDSVREALGALLRALEFEVGLFASALDFLRSDRVRKTDCLILDVRMPGMSGLELQRRLAETYRDVPVIFITAHGDEER